jgi:elongation factor G
MARHDTRSLRNVAIVGHGATGKTSLGESILFASGKTDRLGRVDDGSSIMDFEPEEQKRRISISAAVNFVEWEKHRINFIDTPGDANFSTDTKNCLRAVDGAVVVIDAVGGVEFQTEKVWEAADEFSLPRIIFINKMDRERADFEKVLNGVKTILGKKATPLFLPIGAQDSFTGLIDLINMKALTFDDPKGKVKSADLTGDLLESATLYREAMVEDIAESDESLMDKYLSGGDLSLEELKEGLRKAVISGSLVPVICGASPKMIGAIPLVDLIVTAMPSPLDRKPATGKHPVTGQSEERIPDEKAPFSAFVFKTISDPYAGRLTLFRVYSGSVASDFTFYNPARKANERLGNISYLEGKILKPAEAVVPGDIVAVAKLRETYTGDTICDEKNPIVYEKIVPLPPIMSFAVQPKSKGDEEKITSGLSRLTEEDPTLSVHRDDQTREFILSGMGQVHIEIAVEKMKRKFGADVTLSTPKVPYKETIKGKTNVQGRYKKQSGGRGQFGDTWLDIEPLPKGSGFEFVDKIVGGVIPRQYIPAVEKGIVEAMQEGILAGFPVVDVKVSLVDGSYHTVDSSEMAFKIAGSMGFKKGIENCQPTLLEPIVNIEIEIPEEYMGDVIGDLNSRRGRVMGMDSKGHNQIIRGQVPLAEILRYAPDLRSITSGRGNFTYSHSHFEEVPPMIADKIIAQAKKEKEEGKN